MKLVEPDLVVRLRSESWPAPSPADRRRAPFSYRRRVHRIRNTWYAPADSGRPYPENGSSRTATLREPFHSRMMRAPSGPDSPRHHQATSPWPAPTFHFSVSARLGHVPHPSRPGPTPGRLRMSPTCPRPEVLCDIPRCAADRLLSVGGGGDAGPARPGQPFCGRCGRPGSSGSPAGPGWSPTRTGSTPATTRSCAVLRTSSCSTPMTPTTTPTPPPG